MSTNEFRLPDVGEGLTEAELVTWHVAVGDTVKVNDNVCDIETAKSVVELPTPYAGVVQALLVEEGETVEVGTPIIRIGDTAAPADDAPAAPQGSSEKAGEAEGTTEGTTEDAAEEQPMTLVGSGPKEVAVARRPRVSAPGAAAANQQTAAAFGRGAVSPDVEPETADLDPVAPPPSDPSAPGVTSETAPERVSTLAKPAARARARELGIELDDVVAGRADGVITVDDVEAAAPSGAAPSRPVVRRGGEPRETREPIKGLRKAMGEAMVGSAFTLPHVSIWTTVDVTRTTELVERLRTHRDFRDLRVGPLLIAAKAVLLALPRHPIVNSVWDDDAQEIVFKNYVNLGIAAATPRGLVVPNIKDADALALPELAAEIGQLTTIARSGRTAPADQLGGTFTITNVGPFGMDAGTPLINPGESAILCFGAVKRQPWVVGEGDAERLEARDVCTLALSFDHRHIDGESGSRFLADVAGMLEDPATALLF